MFERDYSNTRGYVPYQDPYISRQTYYQTVQGWRSIRAQLNYMRSLGTP